MHLLSRKLWLLGCLCFLTVVTTVNGSLHEQDFCPRSRDSCAAAENPQAARNQSSASSTEFVLTVYTAQRDRARLVDGRPSLGTVTSETQQSPPPGEPWLAALKKDLIKPSDFIYQVGENRNCSRLHTPQEDGDQASTGFSDGVGDGFCSRDEGGKNDGGYAPATSREKCEAFSNLAETLYDPEFQFSAFSITTPIVNQTRFSKYANLQASRKTSSVDQSIHLRGAEPEGLLTVSCVPAEGPNTPAASEGKRTHESVLEGMCHLPASSNLNTCPNPCHHDNRPRRVLAEVDLPYSPLEAKLMPMPFRNPFALSGSSRQSGGLTESRETRPWFVDWSTPPSDHFPADRDGAASRPTFLGTGLGEDQANGIRMQNISHGAPACAPSAGHDEPTPRPPRKGDNHAHRVRLATDVALVGLNRSLATNPGREGGGKDARKAGKHCRGTRGKPRAQNGSREVTGQR